MYINRKQIMETFIRVVGHISDKEYQRRVWIRGEGPECDDYDETCCYFFDQADSIIENYKEFGITDKQVHILKDFYDEFDAFNIWTDRPYLEQDFIDIPEWNKIVRIAKEVLIAFNYQKDLKTE